MESVAATKVYKIFTGESYSAMLVYHA